MTGHCYSRSSLVQGMHVKGRLFICRQAGAVLGLTMAKFSYVLQSLIMLLIAKYQGLDFLSKLVRKRSGLGV